MVRPLPQLPDLSASHFSLAMVSVCLACLVACASLDALFGGGPNTAPMHDEVDQTMERPAFLRRVQWEDSGIRLLDESGVQPQGPVRLPTSTNDGGLSP